MNHQDILVLEYQSLEPIPVIYTSVFAMAVRHQHTKRAVIYTCYSLPLYNSNGGTLTCFKAGHKLKNTVFIG